MSRSKCFQETWFEEFPLWKKLVVRLKDETTFLCTICDKTMKYGKAQILIHKRYLRSSTERTCFR